MPANTARSWARRNGQRKSQCSSGQSRTSVRYRLLCGVLVLESDRSVLAAIALATHSDAPATYSTAHAALIPHRRLIPHHSYLPPPRSLQCYLLLPLRAIRSARLGSAAATGTAARWVSGCLASRVSSGSASDCASCYLLRLPVGRGPPRHSLVRKWLNLSPVAVPSSSPLPPVPLLVLVVPALCPIAASGRGARSVGLLGFLALVASAAARRPPCAVARHGRSVSRPRSLRARYAAGCAGAAPRPAPAAPRRAALAGRGPGRILARAGHAPSAGPSR